MTFFDPFTIFGAKNAFSKNSGSAMHNFIKGFLAPCQNLKKSNDPILRKHLDTRQDGRMDRTFHRILPATAGRHNNATAVDWHLKLQVVECDVGLTKNYCMAVSM